MSDITICSILPRAIIHRITFKMTILCGEWRGLHNPGEIPALSSSTCVLHRGLTQRFRNERKKPHVPLQAIVPRIDLFLISVSNFNLAAADGLFIRVELDIYASMKIHVSVKPFNSL